MALHLEEDEEAYEIQASLTTSQNFLDLSRSNDVILTKEEVAEVASNIISFENSELVAYNLSMQKVDAARALYEELKYWVDAGRI